MATVVVRPGDEVQFIFASEVDTPFGKKTTETPLTLEYNEVLRRLAGKRALKPSRKGIRFSRLVSLTSKAVETGKWTTGAITDKNKVLAKLFVEFTQLGNEDLSGITPFARSKINEMYTSTQVDEQQKKELSLLRDRLDITN